MEESTFMDGVRGVFAVIDRGVYGLITTFYNMIESLTNFTIISGDKISEISGKIYALIALFMIFKISFSLINYLVNPDILSDKTKGGGALIKNIILTCALVVIVPFGFNILYQAQAAILSDNLIGKLVYGDESVDGSMVFSMDDDECSGITASTDNAGDYIALMAFRPFFQLSEESLTSNSDDFGEIKDEYCKASVKGEGASVKNLLANNTVYSAPHVWSTNHFYVVDYTIFLSTVVGVILALVFLSFCFDIATRTIKLQFLELLAPIPIISYIDPDKSKNGMFSKWLKEVFTTWLSLFMRLLAFHIAIYLISVLKDVQLEGESLWINLLIIIGVLMFAKELPKLLENIMGIKMSGSFNLNPLKKIGDNALGGKAMLGLGAGAVGAVGGGIAGGIAGMNAGAPGRGLAIGMANGFKNGKANQKTAFTSGMSRTYKDMTGNEMVNLTPSKLLMGIDGKGKKSVGVIKDHLKTARGRLNNAQNRLGQISYHNQLAANELRKRGINDLSAAKATANSNISSLQASKNGMSSRVADVTSSLESARLEYNKAKEFYDNYKSIGVNADGKTPLVNPKYTAAEKIIQKYESGEMDRLQAEYDSIMSEYNSYDKQIKEYEENLRLIDEYEKTNAAEESVRAEISKIEKEIKTLSDEKTQREKFWQVDSSTKTSVEEAMSNNPRE